MTRETLTRTTENRHSTHGNGYNAGHPWYYILGGNIPKPKQILACVKESGYRGYMADVIHEATHKPEPKRSAVLRSIKAKVLDEVRRDLSRYRTLAHEIRRYRLQAGLISDSPVCEDIHVSMSLKYCHLYNGFAHLLYLRDVMSYQPDLFL